MIHEPVLLQKVLALLEFKKGQKVLDGTLGAGGYSQAILERIGEEGRLIVLDRDLGAINNAKKRFESHENIAYCHLNYSSFDKSIQPQDKPYFDRMVLDLGLSMDQMRDPSRGFSFSTGGPLDMRMDTSEDCRTVRDLIHETSEEDLANLIYKWGEERLSRRIAKAICVRRREKPIETSDELAEIIKQAHPKRYSRIHPATRTFQALRMVVNREMEHLEKFLEIFPEYLCSTGRVGIVTFHSIEDRAVKYRFRELAKTGEFRLVNKKVEIADKEEVDRNPASRSAKLRVIERN